MQLTDNTVLITGGGSGIGRGLAEALHARGNRVIITGRRQEVLDETTEANPGMASVALDVTDPAAIRAFAAEVTALHPRLNVLVNNAGITRREKLREGTDPAVAQAVVTTNLLGPIWLTNALLPHLLRQPRAAILNVTSGLAMVPFPLGPTYSATKAALHSYTQAMRVQLRGTAVQVIEIIPPYVQTELGGAHQLTDPRAMPLKDYIAETMHLLEKQPEAVENCVERVKPLRFAEANGTFDKMLEMLAQLSADFENGTKPEQTIKSLV